MSIWDYDVHKRIQERIAELKQSNEILGEENARLLRQAVLDNDRIAELEREAQEMRERHHELKLSYRMLHGEAVLMRAELEGEVDDG